ncbi:hypothetical protein PSPO01_08038, partial [Paraphaeosphaeria sporulosa]
TSNEFADLSSTVASIPTSPFAGRDFGNSRNHHFQWSIVVLKNGVHSVYNVELHSGMTGITAMHAIRKAYKDTKPTVLLFQTRSILEDAFISSGFAFITFESAIPFRDPFLIHFYSLCPAVSYRFTTNPDPEAQDYPRRIIVASIQLLIELTEAFHDPSLLVGSGAAVLREIPQFNSKNCIDGHYHAILIRSEASHCLLVAGMAGAILVAGVIGYTVGRFTKSAMLGVVAGATAVSVFAYL